MGLEYELRDGALVWIRNPHTGVISYVVDVRGKSFAFTLGERHIPHSGQLLEAEAIRHATRDCPFCPGNEAATTRELFRMTAQEMPAWNGGVRDAPWVIRVVNNLFPRIPAELTGGRNESYIVIEDPRHFVDAPRAPGDLMYTGALGEEHFFQLLMSDTRVIRGTFENPAVRSVVIRKNQGRESGASQPHLHQQIIGSPAALPSLAAEARTDREHPEFWNELLALVEGLGLVLEHHGAAISFQSPIGTFPRSYDVVMPGCRGMLHELAPDELRSFARLLFRLLWVLGPLPLDYEIHQGEGLPIHAHVNARLFPYSNVAGTLNLPGTLFETAAAIRKALERI
jgi:UDPglucose--hexose-1-phosphate uridylyltransferase